VPLGRVELCTEQAREARNVFAMNKAMHSKDSRKPRHPDRRKRITWNCHNLFGPQVEIKRTLPASA
jgi:hypothetical protein